MKLSKKVTVVIVNDFDYVQGGASKVAINSARLLVERGYRVIFFSAVHDSTQYVDYGYENYTLNINESFKEKNKLKGAISNLYNFKVKKEFSHLLKNLDKESTIIHVHGWTKALSSSVFNASFKMGFKTVLTFHDFFFSCPNGGFFNYKTCNSCKKKPLSLKCIATNCDSRNYSIKLFRVLRQKIQNHILKKLKYGIYISDFSLNIFESYLPKQINLKKIYNPIEISKKPFFDILKNNYYLYVGRVSKEKGVETFCQAITKANVLGVVVGDGAERNYLEKKYPNISFVGWKSMDNVQKYIKSSKALIFPSLSYETAGLTVLEALSRGVPCIVSDGCAATEFISNNDDGLLFESGNSVNLASMIYKLESNPKFLEKISCNAYKNYWAFPFDDKRHFENLYEMYVYMLNERK